VYLCGVVTPEIWRNPSNPTFGDVQAQTKQVLQRIDELLADAGIWLADMSLFAEHNKAWNAWVDPRNPPVRACVEARLTHPELLVEIMCTAAR
jgi:enamine deaminase RidA (YjgF/YER057c/UK114 family)